MMLLWVLVIFTQFEGGSAADGIQPLFLEQHVLEGADVSLSCNYSGSFIQGFQWYRQYPGSSPEFLLFLTESSNGSDPARRLTAEAKKHLSHVDLKISSAAVSDSVLYYCALQPTGVQVLVLMSVLIRLDQIRRLMFLEQRENLLHSDVLMIPVVRIFISSESCVSQSISPLEEKVDAVEGETVTLSCRYEKADYLHWYRQYSGSRPEFLLLKIRGSPAVTHAVPRFPRLDVNNSNDVVNLTISSTAVSDSALYYCALQPTVTGNPDTLYRNWFCD
ncbi:hypothetical protein NFI96_029211 [Prochilodus magdalenae]|nr:hypothetical protein NFI96_029211 [Prochilodus magdalenae]